MKLYEHQRKILEKNRKKCGIFLGTGGGKTLVALLLSEGTTLVICPKQQREDKTWQKNAEKFGIFLPLTVISKEDLRRDWETLPPFDTVIADEVHTLLGVGADTRRRKGEEIPKTSQIYEAFSSYLQKHPPKRLYLCSATPMSKPMNVWALATLLGQKWNFYEFRQKYYVDIRMGFRRIWLPRNDKATKDKLASLIRSFGYVGSLNDFFDVPPQTEITEYIELSPEQKKALSEISRTEADQLVRRAKERTVENGVLYGTRVESEGITDTVKKHTEIFPSRKIDYILERAEEFPKLLVFANYTAQINAIDEALTAAGYRVITLTGATKDRKGAIEEAEKAEACVVVAQCSVSSGYELPSFPCCIFASKSWQYLHMEQGKGRILRANAMKKNLYIHLVVRGGADERCHEAIMSGKDFAEKLQCNEEKSYEETK